MGYYSVYAAAPSPVTRNVKVKKIQPFRVTKRLTGGRGRWPPPGRCERIILTPHRDTDYVAFPPFLILLLDGFRVEVKPPQKPADGGTVQHHVPPAFGDYRLFGLFGLFGLFSHLVKKRRRPGHHPPAGRRAAAKNHPTGG